MCRSPLKALKPRPKSLPLAFPWPSLGLGRTPKAKRLAPPSSSAGTPSASSSEFGDISSPFAKSSRRMFPELPESLQFSLPPCIACGLFTAVSSSFGTDSCKFHKRSWLSRVRCGNRTMNDWMPVFSSVSVGQAAFVGGTWGHSCVE